MDTRFDDASPWVRRWAPLSARAKCSTWPAAAGATRACWPRSAIPCIAVDRDPQALAAAAGAGIDADRIRPGSGGQAWPFEPGRFAGIVVTNYLHRPLFGALAASLAPDGVLIYETFARGNEALRQALESGLPAACRANCWAWPGAAACACWPSRMA
jgi:SAM-dependent methyltransferase